MRLEMETSDDPVWIEDYGDHICVEAEDYGLLNLNKQQAEQMSDILRVWAAGQ